MAERTTLYQALDTQTILDIKISPLLVLFLSWDL